MGKRKIRYYVLLVLLSMCVAAALTMNYEPMENCSWNMNTVYWEMLHGFWGTSLSSTVLALVLIKCNCVIDRLKKEKMPGFTILGIIIALICVMGESFSIDNTLSALSASPVQVFKSTVYIVGIAYLLEQSAVLVTRGLDRNANVILISGKVWDKIRSCYRKHTYLTVFVITLIMTFPQLFFSYPARMSYDARYQLAQYFGLNTFTSHHPPVSTWLMGKIVSIGQLFGNGNVGVFLYICVQYILYAAVTAYLLYTIRYYLKSPLWLQLVTLFIFEISPYHAAYVGQMLKDILYAYMVLVFIIEMAYFLGEEKTQNKVHLLLFLLSSCGVILFRNNGKYVVYPSLLILLLYAWKRKADRKYLLMIAVGALLICGVLNGLLEQTYSAEKGSIREALSLPFQQTARYVQKYDDEIPQEEKEIINHVLDYENLGELYDPGISDPVKGTYKETASKSELLQYFSVWLRQFIRHPFIYVEATVNQNYFLIWPKAELYSYFTRVVYEDYEPSRQLGDYLHLREVTNPFFKFGSALQELYTGLWLMIPILGWTSNLAIYNMLLILICYLSYHYRCRKTLILMLPLILCDLIIIAAPYVSPRYALPVIYAMPVVIACYIYEKRYREHE